MITPDRVTYGEIIYPPGGTLGPRPQRYYQLVIVYSGTMTAQIDGVSVFAGANTVTFLAPGHSITFLFATEQATHHAWVHIALPELAEEVQQRLLQSVQVIPLSLWMKQLMAQLLDLRTATLPTAAEITQLIAAQMLWLYLGEAEQHSVTGRASVQIASVEKAQHYINAYFHEPLTLAQIAQTVSLSPAHLIRLFRQQVGITPLEYVWRQRVKIGVELLEQTGLTVKEIAAYCGFKSSFHFSRRVKETIGLTPTQVRQRK